MDNYKTVKWAITLFTFTYIMFSCKYIHGTQFKCFPFTAEKWLSLYINLKFTRRWFLPKW